MSPEVRRDQLGSATADVVDERLPLGVLGVRPGQDWTLVATRDRVLWDPLDSYDDMSTATAESYTVVGHYTRTLMIRQIWGAHVLQCGTQRPDCEANDHWTFTVFTGEQLTDGCAESGTVLKRRVRFRLGKPNRAIKSARVAPAIASPGRIPPECCYSQLVARWR